jgi:spore coat protein H
MATGFHRRNSTSRFPSALASFFLLLAACAISRSETRAENRFDDGSVWRVQIELSAPNAERLRVEPRKYVPANISISGELIREVGIQLKGYGSFQSLDEKPNFTIDFGKFVRGQRSGELEKVHLNNSIQDGTYIKEKLGTELFAAAGVPAPRVTHALLELNGRSLGLYVLKEGFTVGFLQRHFERADGNLYDTDKGHDLDQRMERDLGAAKAKDQTELKRAAKAAAEPDLHLRWEQLQKSVNLEQFFRFMAMEIMICHWDGYCLSQNNFRIYHDPKSERLVFLPAGMDQLFSKPDFNWRPEMAGLIARAIMAVPEGRNQYEATFRALFQQTFDLAHLTNRVRNLTSKLRSVLKESEFEAVKRESLELCSRIALRKNSLFQQLQEPGPERLVFTNGTAPLTIWKAYDEPPGGWMRDNGNAGLQIVAGPKTSASWRTTVRLQNGRYRFVGSARTFGVAPLSFGSSRGASLRLFGREGRSAELSATDSAERLQVEFQVDQEEEDITLVCELRARAGEVVFDRASLAVIQVR